jgi:RNA polymerase sigma-70 factor, ECF subfamily
MEPSNLDPGTSTLIRLKRYDNEAWAKMVGDYVDQINRWCLEAGLQPEIAADIVQETFFSALGSLHQFEKQSESSFGGWLRRICQRRIADHFRKKADVAIGGSDAFRMFSSVESVRRNLGAESNSPLDISDDRLMAAITKAQTEFEHDTWRAFWMTMVEGRSTTDAALEIGITKNAVYLAKSRISKRLKLLMSDEQFLEKYDS